MRWQQKLTKKQLRHVNDSGMTTLARVKQSVLAQSQNVFPCWECVEIGRKLGIEVELIAFNALPPVNKVNK